MLERKRSILGFAGNRRLEYSGLLIAVFLFFLSSCVHQSSHEPIHEQPNSFCGVLSQPEAFLEKEIRVEGLLLGYHFIIFYHPDCLDETKVVALDIDSETRGLISEEISKAGGSFQTRSLGNNLYARVEIVGLFAVNDIFWQEGVSKPKFKIKVQELLNVSVPFEEIPPPLPQSSRIEN
jgi:hypothetical protein